VPQAQKRSFCCGFEKEQVGWGQHPVRWRWHKEVEGQTLLSAGEDDQKKNQPTTQAFHCSAAASQ